MLPPEAVAMATGRNFAVFTTLRPDGHPAAQVMWVDADQECILINTEKHRRKFRNVQRDPRVTVTLINSANPYNYIEVRGTVVEVVEGQPARDHIDKLAWRYFGRPYDPAAIQSERVILRIRPLATGMKP
ncbi:MAG TPA: PPOX class F420-dependent oxidoreductase [Nakamurella sp.]|jgi:PPOX class probable F420-dependent enzyme|nr:PPOX class F420-dependent oxidoreductase [Nakamurella sp.]